MAKQSKAVEKLKNYNAGDLDRAAGDRWVTMNNALIRAGHGLTLSEKRLVIIGVSKLDSKKVYAPLEVPKTKITAAEYAETFAVDMNTAYDQLQATAKKLYERSISYYEAADRRNGKPIESTLVKQRWVGSVKYHNKEGWIELHWWPHTFKHLSAIKDRFTTYQLKQTSALRSVYTWRLFELLMRFKSTGHAKYDIEDFCTSLDVPIKHKANFAKIRTKIIEPAVRELNEKDGWLLQWQPIKAGRKVKALRFTFEKNPQLDLFIPRTPDIEQEESDIASLSYAGQ